MLSVSYNKVPTLADGDHERHHEGRRDNCCPPHSAATWLMPATCSSDGASTTCSSTMSVECLSPMTPLPETVCDWMLSTRPLPELAAQEGH